MINLALFVGELILLGLVFLRVTAYEITQSTYEGIFVTMMGVAVAFVIGYQIFNTIAIKEDLKEQKLDNDQLRTRLADAEKSLSQKIDKQERDAAILRAITEENRCIFEAQIIFETSTVFTRSIDSFMILHSALIASLDYNSNNYEYIFRHLRKYLIAIESQYLCEGSSASGDDYVLRIANPNSADFNRPVLEVVEERYISKIKATDKKIREHPNFLRIQFEYNRIMSKFYDHVKKCATIQGYVFPIEDCSWEYA